MPGLPSKANLATGLRGAFIAQVIVRTVRVFGVGYRSGQPGQTVNLLAYAYGGSNPPPTTAKLEGVSGFSRE